MRDPDWGVPHGWKAATNKEIVRVEGFNGWVPITGRERRRLQNAHPQQVTNGHIVAILTVKRDPSGNPRAPDIVRKMRVAISDPQAKDMPIVESYSSCVDAMSNIIITALAPALGAEQTSLDVGGAYWHGTPPALHEGGRIIIAPVPAWMAGMGTGRYGRATGTSPRGRSQALPIGGTAPGEEGPASSKEHRRIDGSARAVIHDMSPSGEYDISPSGSS